MNSDKLADALRKAFNLGQTYWQQVDSEYPSQWKKGDVTRAKLGTLIDETITAHSAQPHTLRTMVGHAPDCCGCWNINTETLLATCNECGVTRDVASFLATHDSAQDVGKGWVLVPRWKLERAAQVVEDDGDEHGVGRDIRIMLDQAAHSAQGAGDGWEYEFEIEQDGEFVAGGTTSTPDAALSEATHYEAMYGQDGGPVIARFWRKQPISRDALAAPTKG